MVAIVSGNGCGLGLTSLSVLGQRGVLGVAAQGRNGESAYLNAATGNLILQDQDDHLVGHGLDVGVIRTYNSQGQFTDDNGDNWLTGGQRVTLTGQLLMPGSTVTRTGADGSQAVYSYDVAQNRYISTAGGGSFDAIDYDFPSGHLVWKDGDSGLQEHYESTGAGRLLQRNDAAGNTLTYSYGGNGLLSSVLNANGEGLVYDYSGNNLTQVRTVFVDNGVSKTQTRVHYSYDASNRLSTVTVDLSPEDGAVADGKVYQTTYTYDGTSQRIASITQSDGSSQSFTYVQVGAEYRVASATDGLGQVTTFSYDTANRKTIVTDALNLQTVYEYDAAGQLTRITAPAVAGVTQSNQFVYDAAGNVVQVIDGAGRAVDMQYDSHGNQILQRDAAGNTVTRTYDANNLLQTETAYLVPDPDGAGAGQPGQALTTRYVYDAAGQRQLRYVLTPEGRVTEYRYNATGERITSLQYAGGTYPVSGLGATDVPSEAQLDSWRAQQDLTQTQRSDMSYDVRGQLASLTTYARTDSAGNGVTDGSQSVLQYVYDAAGQLRKTVAATGGTTQYTYDGLGRQLSVSDALGQITLTQYDDPNNKTKVTLVNGLATTRSYDKAGRLVSVAQTNPAAQLLGETKYFYDADGRLRMTQDPTGVKHWMLYDEMGRKVADIDADGSLTEYRYNQNNQQTASVAYATRVNVAALTDGQGQPVATTLAAVRPATTAADSQGWMAYDAAGRLVKTVDAGGAVTETTYDGASHVLSVIHYANTIATGGLGDTPTAEMIAPKKDPLTDRISRNFYSDDGLLRGTLDAEGTLTELRYNGEGQLTERITYATPTDAALRASGTLAQLIPAASAKDVHGVVLYNGKGQVVAEIDGENYLTEKVYDANGNLTQSIRYANRVTVPVTPTTALATLRPAANSEDQSISRTYDALNRVIQEINAEGTVTQYVYDNVGNLVSTLSAVGADLRTLTARYDLQGRLVGELSGTGGAQLTGNQTQAQIDALWAQYGTTYAYDAAGRRISTTDAQGHKTLFYYDADGHLIYSINALGEVEEHEYDGLNQLTATRRYGSRLNPAGLNGGIADLSLINTLNTLRNVSLDSTVRYTYNTTGTLASQTDALGNVTRYGYDAFGEAVSATQDLGGGQSVTQTTQYDRRGQEVTVVADAGGLNLTTRLVYDAFGRVVQSTDANGNVRQQAYDRLGRVVQTQDPLGAQQGTTYDAFGRTLTQTDALGKTTTYSYDKNARSVTVTTPEGVSVTTTRNRQGQTATVTDGKGLVTSYSYDKNGNLLQTQTPLTTTLASYDTLNQLIESTDGRGVKTRYSYDAVGRLLTRTEDPNGLKLTTTYAYDAKGQQIEVTDAKGVKTVTSFDLKGEVVRQTQDPTGLNLQTTYTYDARGKVLNVTDAKGVVTQYVYDKAGRRIQEIRDPGGLNLVYSYQYDKNGNSIAVTDPNGNVSRSLYDADDRLCYSIDVLGAVRKYDYDAAGRLVQTTAYATPISLSGLSVTPTTAEINARLVSTAADQIENRIYDQDGRLHYTVDGTGAVTQQNYDANGNVVEQIAYANRINRASWTVGTTPAVVADAAHDQRLRTVYDALNRAIYSVNAVGSVVAQSYDGNGNVIDRVAYATAIAPSTPATAADLATAVAGIANALRDQHVRNVYDAANRLTWSANGVGAVTQHVYDANGNAIKDIQYASAIAATAAPSSVVADASQDRVTTRAYDSANRLVFTVDTLGGVSQNSYDANGNLVQTTAYAQAITLPANASVANIQSALVVDAAHDRTTRFAYDAANRQVYAVDAQGAVRQTSYDANGHVVQTTAYAKTISLSGLTTGAAPATIAARLQNDAANDRTTRAAFDAAGRLVYQVDPLGYVQQTTYDGLGRVVATTQYANAIGAATSGVSGIAAALVADAANDRTNTFVFDAAGNLSSSTDALGYSESYSYNGLNQKTGFTNKNGATWTYTYDAAGFMVQETSPRVALTTVTTDANGKLVASDVGSVAIVTALKYDALGNLIARTEAQGRPEERTTKYSYDALGRQIVTEYPTVGVYDPKNDNPVVNGANGLAERKEATLTLFTRTWYDTLGNAVASRDVAGGYSAKAYDRLGQVAYDIDALGYVTGYQRDGFGQVTALTRYATATNLTAFSDLTLNTAVPKVSVAQVQGVLTATGVDHSGDRVLKTDYDQLGRVVRVIEPQVYTYDSSAAAGSQYFTAGKTTQKVYNAFGDLVQTQELKNAQANSWTNTYHYVDRRGQETATVDALGYLTTRNYDGAGNVVASTEYATALTAGNWSLTGYGTAPTTADDRTLLTVYDRGNRKTRETRVGIEASTASDGTSARQNAVTSYGYDAVGNQTRVTDALGNSSYSYYDALGRVAANTAATRSSTANGAALTPLTVFQRDAHGNVVVKQEYALGAASASEAGYTLAGANAADRVTRSRYDSHGHAVQTLDAEGFQHYASYNARGDLAKEWMAVTDRDGVTRTKFTVNQYDQLGHLTHTIDPASTNVFKSGLFATYTPATVVTTDEGGMTISGMDSLTLKWSSQVDPNAGLVRVTVNYRTVDTYAQIGTDEYGTPIYAGVHAQEKSLQQDFSASDVTSGAALDWSKTVDVGQIAGLQDITITQLVDGQWVTRWSGRYSEANGSGATTVTQAEAGVIDTASEYNAFGEVVRKGVNGGRQEYFDYDNAGHVWRTNSGDGVDKVSLYDLAGHQTATIQSSGSGRNNADFRVVPNAVTAASATDARRTDIKYDDLGRVVEQVRPERLDTQGGATVRHAQVISSIASSATPGTVYDATTESSSFAWSGSNQVNLSWSDLSNLGGGDIKVVLNYRTQSYEVSPAVPAGTDEAGNIIPAQPAVIHTGIDQSRTQVVSGVSGASGTTFGWQDSGADGGISQITGYSVYKKDRNGQWQLVVDRTGTGSNVVEVSAPANGGATVSLQLRAAGSSGNTGWFSVPLTDFGDALRFDASALAAGNYEYQVLTTVPGQQATATATGTVKIGPLALDAIALSFASAGQGILAWQSPGNGVEQVLRYRAQGSSGAWTAVAVTARGNGLDGADLNALAGGGSYEYELLWTRSGTLAPFAHATGTVSVTPGTAAYWVPPVGLPHISGVTLGTRVEGATVTYDENGTATSSGGTTVRAISWQQQPAGTSVTFRYRVSGTTSWSTLPVQADNLGVDESGQAILGQQWVKIDGLAPSNYDYELLVANSSGTSHATGVLTVNAQGPGHYETQNVAVQVAVTVTPPNPDNYITGYTNAQYGSPIMVQVATGTAEDGSTIYTTQLAPHYAWSGNVVVAVPYTESQVIRYDTVQEAVQVPQQVTTTVTPPNPDNYITGYTPAQYSSPVIVQVASGTAEDGSTIYTTQLGAHYAWSGSVVVGVPYSVQQLVRYDTKQVQVQVAVQVPVQQQVLLGYDDESGAPIYGTQTVYVTQYQTQTQTQQVPVYQTVTVTPPDPASYMTVAPKPIYGSPILTDVVSGYNEDGSPIYTKQLAAHYAWSGDRVVAVPYNVTNTVYVTQYQNKQVAVYGNVTVTPANPASYMTAAPKPIYGSPILTDVVSGYNEDGSPIYTKQLAAHYAWSGDRIVAVPYTVYQTQQQQQQVWIAGTTPAPTMTDNTGAYTPGYTVAAVPAKYTAVINTPAGSSAISVSANAAGTGITQTVGANGGSVWQRPVIRQKVDRWGNTLEVNDSRSLDWKTSYRYNANNQVVQETKPDSAGAQGTGSAVTQMSYDLLGRVVAKRDANGNLSGQVYDAAGQLIEERHADGGVVRHAYDAFGQKVKDTDALGHVTQNVFDRLGRQTQTIHEAVDVYTTTASSGATLQFVATRAQTEIYTYDQMGNKLTSTNGNGETLRYRYDLSGNLIEVLQPLGQVNKTFYDKYGHKMAEVDGNGYANTWTYDYFGRTLSHGDIGGAVTSYTYDFAGQVLKQTNTRGMNLSYSYDAVGQVTKIVDASQNKVSSYAYDLTGNRVREKTVQNGVVYQDNHLAYDALGRLRDVADGQVHITMDYDKNGNRTHVTTHALWGSVASGESIDTDRWFAYDNMNRQIVVDGVKDANTQQVVMGTSGHRLTYDLNGNRATDTYWGRHVNAQQVVDHYDPVYQSVYQQIGFEPMRDESGNIVYDESGNPQNSTTPVYGYVQVQVGQTPVYRTDYSSSTGETTEAYSYDAVGRLQRTTRDGVAMEQRYYDGADRVLQQSSLASTQALQAAYGGTDNSEALGTETRITRFDANGRQVYQRTLSNTGAAKSAVFNNAYDAAGNQTSYQVASYQGTNYTNTYASTMARFDGYKETRIDGSSTVLQSGATTESYDANGFLTGVVDTRQSSSNRSFVNDVGGKILQTDQGGNISRQVIANGEVLGRYGMSGAGQKLNDFNAFGYKQITAGNPSPGPGSYTVQLGDTLQSIARGAYGDSQQWYRIAEANGLASDNDLRVGQTLILPTVVSSASRADSYSPYDPSKVVGDKTPFLPLPPPPPKPKKGGCGGIGTIIMVIVAVVATIFTAGAAALAMAGTLGTTLGSAGALTTIMSAGASAMLGGGIAVGGVMAGTVGSGIGALGCVAAAAIGGAVGSIASQGVGIAMGVQDKFSWKAVGSAAVNAGVGAAVGGATAGWGQGFAATVGRAAISSTLSQGICVATGLQKSFSWQSVAAAAASSAINYGMSNALGEYKLDDNGERVLDAKTGQFARGDNPLLGSSTAAGIVRDTFKGIVSSTAVNAMKGGKMTVQQIATDAFGNALGNALNEDLMTPGEQDQKFKSAQETAGANSQDSSSSSASKLNIGVGYKPADYSLGQNVKLDAMQGLGSFWWDGEYHNMLSPLNPTSGANDDYVPLGRGGRDRVVISNSAQDDRSGNGGLVPVGAHANGIDSDGLAARKAEIEYLVARDILGQEARDASVAGGYLLQTGGTARAPRGFGSSGFEMVRNGNWDGALNLAADPFGLLGEFLGLKDDLAQLSQVQAKNRVDDMRQRMLDAGVKNVPDYARYVSANGSGIDFQATAESLNKAYESHIRDQRLRETWGDDYQNVRIGKSRMTPVEFEQKVLDIHQRATDVAYERGVDLIARGELVVKDGQYARTLGNYIDERVRFDLRGFARVEGINDSPMSNIWAINRRIKSDDVPGYGIPDGRIGMNLYHDTTLARKDGYTPQISKWNAIQKGNVLIVRPSQLGGSYAITRDAIQPYAPQPRLPGRRL